jgi:hypothetical protein
MKTTGRPGKTSRLFATLLVLGSLSFCAAQLHAQAAGNNAVFGSTSACSSGGCVASTAFIDASVLSGTDLCAQINYALTHSYPTTGTVIDARGINGTGFSQTCSSGTPWGLGSNTTTTNPSTILLPPGTIKISNTWTLPNGTRIVGTGPGQTIIQAQSNISTIIEMGSSAANGISVEDLTLDGEGYSLNGIVNSYAKELSYVRHVDLYRIGGTGLSVSSSAQNSGPYSDIVFNAAGDAASSTVCAQISGVSTRGIHGLTCISGNPSTSYPSAGVLLDASNNSIEDVQIQGFTNGVLVGKDANAQNDVLLNVSGNGTLTNVVHICGSIASPCPSTPYTVTDLTLIGIATGGGTLNSIRDDLTKTTLADPTVAMYVLGQSVAVGLNTGYSRFTTSVNTTTWGVGNGAPSTGCATKTTGSLFSNTSTTSGSTALYVCNGTTWKTVK